MRAAVLLEVVELSKRYGGLTAVGGISFGVAEHEILGIFGPNGSGKTTLLNLIGGLIAPTSGRILWKMREIQGRRPDQIAAAGIVKTFQNPQLFTELTALEHLMIASHLRLKRARGLARIGELLGRGQGAAAAAGIAERARQALALCRLERVAEQRAANLSYGEEKMLGVAMALMCDPELLLLDEPASGLGEEEIRNLEAVLRDLQAQGTALCIIDHKVGFLGKLAHRAIVLQQGSKIAEGPPLDVLRDPRVVEAYLGRHHA